MNRRIRGVTLLELLIAIILLGMIVLGFASIDLFSRYHVVTSDQRAKVQNDATYVLEHMAKYVGLGIGDETNPPDSRAVDLTTIGGNTAIKVWIDYNQNAKRDAYPTDRRIAYRFTGTGGSTPYQIRYCPECTDNPCTACNPAWDSNENILSKKITAFTPSITDNYVTIELTTCWDSDGDPVACGTPDNPSVTMRNRINMPAVSTH